MGMFELLALLFIVGVGYMIYRVIRHIKKRNEQADAYDSVLAGMERMNAGRNAPPETNASSPSYPSHVVMGMPIPPIIPPVIETTSRRRSDVRTVRQSCPPPPSSVARAAPASMGHVGVFAMSFSVNGLRFSI